MNTSEWGRPDETSCQTVWTDNLPTFDLPTDGPLTTGRCAGAGEEIKEKMMDRNGFTKGKIMLNFLSTRILCFIIH